jgi:diguanylate cyclase (GGDEF)-like protein
MRRSDAHHAGPLHDDGPLPDLTSGLMWLATGLAGLGVLPLADGGRVHLVWAIVLAGFAIAWGAASVTMGLRGITMPLRTRAWVTAGMMPVVALALWATGGCGSFLQPVMLFTALFVGYFFPPRHAWPLAGLFVAAYASPLLYDPAAVASGYPARAVMFVVAVAGSVLVVQFLKRRLVQAEAHQRTMAERDPLTGLHNRRSFDRALSRTIDGCALVIFDFDAFKAINDTHGHPIGDAVLRAVANACAAVVREGDCLARIGGDEFALVAPRAGAPGAARVVAALADAVEHARMPVGVDQVHATFAYALAPDDGADPAAVFACADERLLLSKRAARAQRAAAAQAA